MDDFVVKFAREIFVILVGIATWLVRIVLTNQKKVDKLDSELHSMKETVVKVEKQNDMILNHLLTGRKDED